MYFDKSILSLLESTTLECTTVGGSPTDRHNLTLWKNNELLATNHGLDIPLGHPNMDLTDVPLVMYIIHLSSMRKVRAMSVINYKII